MCIIETDSSVFAAVDRERSFPFFYTIVGNHELVISDDAYALLEHCTPRQLDNMAVAELLFS